MQRLFLWFSPPKSNPAPLSYFESCPELKNVATTLAKLKKQKETLESEVSEAKVESLVYKKYTILSQIVDGIDTLIIAFNNAEKGSTQKTELERQEKLCTDIQRNLILSPLTLKILNQYRNPKKPIAVATATLVPIVGGIATAVTTSLLAGAAVLFGGGVARETVMWAASINPLDAETVTLLTAAKKAACDAKDDIARAICYLPPSLGNVM